MKQDFKHIQDRYLHRETCSNSNLDTSSKLLAAAVKVFSKYGYERASIREIADVAGVKHGLIKYHYKNKETLWKAVITFLYDMMLDALKLDEQIGDSITDPDELRSHMIAMTRNYIRFSAKHPELFRILIFETLLETERLDWVVENFTKSLTKKSIKRIRQVKEAGIFPKHISSINIFYLMMTANRTIFLLAPEIKQSVGLDMFSEEALSDHENAVIEMMFR